MPINYHAPSLIRFLPGFNLATLIATPDHLQIMSSQGLKLLVAGKPVLAALLIGLMAPVFLIGNLGVRCLGLPRLWRAARYPGRADPMNLMAAVLVGAAWVCPILFVQQGEQWNTIQFFYYAILIAAVPAAEAFWDLTDALQPYWKYAWLAIFLILGAPGVIQAMVVLSGWGAHLPAEDCRAYEWLKRHAEPRDVIVRPLPDAMMTDTGYAFFMRLQEREK